MIGTGILSTAAAALQAHGGAGAQEEAAHGAAQGHGAEWGTETMLNHITDARVLDLGFTEVHLPSIPPIHMAGLEIDLSVTKHVVFLFVAALLTIVTMWAAAREARKLDHGEEAPGGVLNAMEAFYFYLRDEVALANIGRGGERFVPLVVTLFFFILYANLLGLVPFGATATSNIMVTSALALVSLVVIEAAGMSELGFKGWLGTIFFTPKGAHPVVKALLLPIFTVVEIIGKLAKPFALAVRLFANMTAGHFVILALLGLIITYGGFTGWSSVVSVVGPLVLGLFVMFLEIFVAFVQAYIFAILTAVFIGLIRHAH
jgi:F-type H+-transporting ATPase subunit a